jgi:hypothetical protein
MLRKLVQDMLQSHLDVDASRVYACAAHVRKIRSLSRVWLRMSSLLELFVLLMGSVKSSAKWDWMY